MNNNFTCRLAQPRQRDSSNTNLTLALIFSVIVLFQALKIIALSRKNKKLKKEGLKMNKQLKYSILFFFTGIFLILFSLLVKIFFANINIGYGIPFSEAEVYLIIGLIWIFFGLIYYLFYKFSSIPLSVKQILQHYFFTIFFLVAIMAVPILDEYYPTNLHRDSFLWKFFTFYTPFSVFLFLYGIIIYLFNIIKSTITYVFIINKRNIE